MSNESGGHMPIPKGTDSHVVQDIQYGMVMPNGRVEWDKVTIRGREYAIKNIADGNKALAYDWQQELEKRAEAANVNPYDYSNQHKIVTRSVVLAVTATANHSTLRPWPAPDPGQRPEPVAETAASEEDPFDLNPPTPPMAPWS